MKLTLSFPTLLLALPLVWGVLEGPIQCPLVWEPFTVGYAVPSDAVPAIEGSENNFIIRGVHTTAYRIGRVDTNSTGALIPDDSDTDVVIPGDLQILRNAHGCDMEWKRNSAGTPEDQFLTPSGGRDRRFVGRGLVNGEYLSGEVVGSSGSIIIAGKNGAPVTLTDFYYLTSSSDGFVLEFTDLTFTGDDFKGAVDFMGIDTISNGGWAEISQTLNHRKTVTTSMSVSHDRSWSYAYQVNFNFGINYDFVFAGCIFNALGLNIGFSFNIDNSWGGGSSGTSYGQENTIEVSSTRVITVPPYNHVQACTLLGMIEKFSRGYIAVGIYRAKGWTGQEIYDYLNSLSPPPEKMEVKETYVTSTERGTFGGNLFLSNVLIITNTEEENGDCLEIQRLVAKLRDVQDRGRRFKQDTSVEEAELESRIKHIINGGARNRTNVHP